VTVDCTCRVVVVVGGGSVPTGLKIMVVVPVVREAPLLGETELTQTVDPETTLK
jgi:hypothetical protein